MQRSYVTRVCMGMHLSEWCCPSSPDMLIQHLLFCVFLQTSRLYALFLYSSGFPAVCLVSVAQGMKSLQTVHAGKLALTTEAVSALEGSTAPSKLHMFGLLLALFISFPL